MKKRLLPSLVVGFLVFCFVYLLSTYSGFLLGMDRFLLNGYFYLREPGIGEPNPFVSDRVKLLGYDEDAIAVIGKWPWKRHVHARFLNNIRQFSPETVFFDVIFAKPETVPDFVREKLESDPEALEKVTAAFQAMDASFARVMSTVDNVYLDLQLVEEEREDLPAFYQKRIRLNEQVMENHSLPSQGPVTPVIFNSLEPILDDYVKNAHPAVINVLPGNDGVVRMFPLFFSYRMTDGSFRNVFTVVLTMLQRYFHVGRDQIDIRARGVTIRSARVPLLSPDTRKPALYRHPLDKIIGKIANPLAPEGYAYNHNLYRMLVFRLQDARKGVDKAPGFPLHVLKRTDGRFEILDSWEVLDAAVEGEAGALRLAVYEERDLFIETPVPGFYHINYAGKDEQFFNDPKTGHVKLFHHIPTESYKEVYTLDVLPDIPDPDDSGIDRQALSALLETYEALFEKYYNRFIFTGGNATGLGDVQNTPYARMFGVNVIINAFNTIATGNPLKTTRDIPNFDVLLLAGLCFLSCLLYGVANIRIGGIIFVFIVLAVFAGGLYAFFSESVFMTTAPLVLANVLVFGSLLVYKLLTEEKDKRFLKETFGAYLAPDLIDEMHRSKTMPTLGGEARIITAFFTDIQGFSTFSEKLTAHQLVVLLNEYLTEMTDILIREGGTLDKYEGDAVIAFFGAPVDLTDQEVRACRAAIGMQASLDRLREKWRNEKAAAGEPDPNMRKTPADQWAPGDRWPRIVHEMRMRIGINTGEIVVGNMGSTMRMNYTMMGDAVNLAARLETAAKQYGVYTVVSEYSLDVEYIDENGENQRVMEMVETRYLDKIQVVGRKEPVKVFELLAMKGALTEEEQQLKVAFENGMLHYLNMQWDLAIESFSKSYSLERYPYEKTTPSEVFIQRCRAFKKTPPAGPGQKWDGVFRLREK